MSHIILGGSANALAIARLLKDPNSIILDFNDCSPAMSTKYAKGLRLLSKNEQEVLETLLSLKAPPPRLYTPQAITGLSLLQKTLPHFKNMVFYSLKLPITAQKQF
ncbi:hypothetical protein [Pseudomonas sp. 273]|uniref:hypothetical protein n=1 Tax=Pseudomonas sp. 273 TaxID=75692 RepID=UPI0023D84BEF|nr:hypothetical protein [Pseudomonas sp. 273]